MKKIVFLLAFVFSFTLSSQAQWYNASSTTPTFTEFGSISFGSSTVGYTSSRGYGNSLPFGYISKTTDAGQSWNVIQNFAGHDLHFTDPNTGFVVVGTEIRKTTDGGVTWNNSNMGSGFTLRAIHFFGPNNGVAVGSGNHKFYTTNGGQSWLGGGNSGSFDFLDVWFADANTVYAGNSDGRVYKSTNGGVSWAFASIVNTNEDVMHVHFPQNQSNPDIGYCITDLGGSSGRKMYKTTNGGVSWVHIQSFTNPAWDRPGEVFFTDVQTGYWASLYRGISKTTDGGITWAAQQTIGTWTGDSTYAIHFINADTGFAVGNGARVLYTYNASSGGGPCSSFSVSAGPDTVVCQNSYTLPGSATGGSGNYSYSWSPSTGLSDPNIANPVANQVHNQTYILTVNDLTNNCMGRDTVVVSSYNFTVDSIPWCNDTLLLDLGPGASSYIWVPGGQTTQTLTVDSPGVYLAVAQFPGCGALTSGFTVYDTCAPCVNFAADAGPDTTFCGGPGQLNVNTSSPGPHNITWAPSTYLNNPGIANPTFVGPPGGIQNYRLTVTVIDSVTLCMDTDTLLVSYFPYPQGGLDTLCNDSLILDLGIYGQTYLWQPSGDTTRYLTVHSGGTYIGFTQYPGCPVVATTWGIVDVCDSVWPGDANSDLIADNFDVLNVGVGYNSSGTPRPNATSNWNAQWAPDWPTNFANNVNYKHADCQGDGTIDSLDLFPIVSNYGLTHNKGHVLKYGRTGDPPLLLQFPMDSIQAGDSVTVDVILGSQQIPALGVYGLAFTVLYDSDLIDSTTVRLDYDPSWFTGSNTYLSLGMNHELSSEIDGALSRTDQVNVNGYGKIASLSFVMEENIALKTSQIIFDSLMLYLADVKVIGIDEQEVAVELIGDTAIVWQLLTALPSPEPGDFRVFPNPASERILVESRSQAIQKLQIYNPLGQLVRVWSNEQGLRQAELSLNDLPEGVYHLKISTAGGTLTKKVVVISK